MIAGLLTGAVWIPSFWLLLAGGIVVRGGAGAAFRGMIATVIAVTPAHAQRGPGRAIPGSLIGV